MPAIVKPTLKTELAQIFQRAIEANTTNSYFFLGKATSWATDSDLGGNVVGVDETNPPNPSTSEAFEKETRRNILSIQKTPITNVSLAIRRYNWTSGTVYDMYDPRYSDTNLAPSGASNLAEAKLFVLTEDFNLYKCIYNNEGAASTVKPTGTSTSYLTLSDGYVWKYMKTVNINERNRYLSDLWVPVSDIVGSGFFDGQVSFSIVSGGTGYVQDNTVLTVSGDGSAADLSPIITSGSITNVVVNDGGTGYTTATIDITTPDSAKAQGTGGDINAIIEQVTTANSQTDVQLSAVDGELSAISITSGGTGYTTATATISGDGSGAIVVPTISGGAISGFTFTNRGSSYTSATVTVTGDGSGFQGDVIVAPPNGHGFSLINESNPPTVALFVDGIDTQIQGKDYDGNYRQLGIIIDPVKFNANDVANYVEKVTASEATPCFLLTNPNIVASNYSFGDKLYDSANNEYLVVDVEDGEMVIQSLSEVDLESGITLATTSIPVINVVIDSDGQITNPTFDRNTGSVVYIDNRVPFRREENQIVNLRTFLEF